MLPDNLAVILDDHALPCSGYLHVTFYFKEFPYDVASSCQSHCVCSCDWWFESVVQGSSICYILAFSNSVINYSNLFFQKLPEFTYVILFKIKVILLWSLTIKLIQRFGIGKWAYSVPTSNTYYKLCINLLMLIFFLSFPAHVISIKSNYLFPLLRSFKSTLWALLTSDF